MRLQLGAIFALTFAAMLSASPLSAATVFNLTGHGGLDTVYNFSEDGINLRVTAGWFTNSGQINTGSQVGQYSRGLGVTSYHGDSHQVDGGVVNDILIFEFDQDVELESVTFSYNDSNDDFRFFFQSGGNGGLIDWGANVDIPGSSFFATYVFSQQWIGDEFGVGAFDDYDNFKVKKVTVWDVIPIPLPAAAPLLLGGLGLLGAMGLRRRRKPQAA